MIINQLRIKEIQKCLAVTVVIFLTTIGIIYYSQDLTISDTCRDYGTYLSVSSTLLGFLITTLAIILTFPENRKIKELKKRDLYLEIYNTFLICLFSLVLFFVLSLIGFIGNIDNCWFCSAVLFALILSIIFIFLIVWILMRHIGVYQSDTD